MIQRVLGQGGQGRVFLARDECLERLVAIKVPRRHVLADSRQLESYRAEARTVAQLDHPNIVPVYDVNSSVEFPCYIVSRWTKGETLASRLRRSRFTPREAAEMIATVADALHYAHKQGLVHRDVKPSNILIDAGGTPHIIDFGLAMWEQDAVQGSAFVGTPAYMSPEQARGEGHRIDGRSDVFSLGAVMYEMLTEHLAFPGTRSEVLEQVIHREPRPPRQYDESLPGELVRICMKALSKRVSERYTTAHDFAQDIRFFLANGSNEPRHGTTPRAGSLRCQSTPLPDTQITPRGSSSGDEHQRNELRRWTPEPTPVPVVPKGLRSFDRQDADFFLDLLPGPRDRDGLPESLRFWKARVESLDPQQAFSVGVIYGPSGCGKSSLVKAGLLPRLGNHLRHVYVEASDTSHNARSGGTEALLMRLIRRSCPSLSGQLTLKQALSTIRQGAGLPPGQKLLLVIDQFEQWLHAHDASSEQPLVDALRQCDGIRVQCIVLVRDDFWLGASRFMRAVEVPMLDGHNSAVVDLFDLKHARKILAAYGRAYGALPPQEQEISRSQAAFLDQAVSELAEDRKVVCVRLALLAEMMKDRQWTPSNLRSMGGTSGVGAAFLDSTFSAKSAPVEHRYHQRAARAVLTALLPDSSAELKGSMKSLGELRLAAAYPSSDDFDALIRILDSDLKLITPCDKDQAGDVSPCNRQSTPHRSNTDEGQYYQLAHDYLVPSLRDWLTRKQRETRRGRAELRLEELSQLWMADKKQRYLPSFWEFLSFCWWTRRRNWNRNQRALMDRAAWVHGVWGVGAALLVAAVLVAALTVRSSIREERRMARIEMENKGRVLRAEGLVRSLLTAGTDQTPAIIDELDHYRQWTDAELRIEFQRAQPNSIERLHIAMALLPVDESVLEELKRRLLDVDPRRFPIVRDALEPFKEQIIPWLWQVATDSSDRPRQLRGAAALATYDPQSQRWTEIDQDVAESLVAAPLDRRATWQDALRPVRDILFSPLAEIFRDDARKLEGRLVAADMIAGYAADRPDQLFDLLADSFDQQFRLLFPKLITFKTQAIQLSDMELRRDWPVLATDDEKERLANRQANAAVVLTKFATAELVWSLLEYSDDARLRSELIDRFSRLDVPPQLFIDRLDSETDVGIRQALLLCLGEFDSDQLPETARSDLLPLVTSLYESDADAGIHAAAQWVIRKWSGYHSIVPIDERLRSSESQIRTLDIDRRWYVNSQGQTFVLLDDATFSMGSPESEPDRQPTEILHGRAVGRAFAICATEVTQEQFARCKQDKSAEFQNNPAGWINWYEAAEYCNWLSREDGIAENQWCYEPNEHGQFAAGMKTRANHLQLTGYRLPTEAEWEYACRGGTRTTRHYGHSDTLLPKYAWYVGNSRNRTQRVGLLKPNAFGLFDSHGNVGEWCQETKRDYPTDVTSEQADVAEQVIATIARVMRGGAVDNFPASVRAADRWAEPPGDRSGHEHVGVRPVRTIPLRPSGGVDRID